MLGQIESNPEATGQSKTTDELKVKIDQQLYEVIKTCYRNLPYHNFSHAKEVANNSLLILDKINKKSLLTEPFNYDKIKELLYLSALFHDAGHLYITTPDDERKSAELAEKLLKRFWYSDLEIEYVKSLILATIFKDRWKIYEEWSLVQKVIADADIASSVATNFDKFMSDNINLLIESLPQNKFLIKKNVLELPESKKWFIAFLTGITKNNNDPFLVKETNIVFPNFTFNKKKLDEYIPDQSLLNAFNKAWESFYWYTPTLLDK